MAETVTVTVGELGLSSLGGARDGDPAIITRSVAQALRYYLADREAGRAGWLYPELMRGEALEAVAEVTISIPGGEWERFAAEAERQRVSTDQLAQHAILYLVADWDSGRLVARILDDLD